MYLINTCPAGIVLTHEYPRLNKELPVATLHPSFLDGGKPESKSKNLKLCSKKCFLSDLVIKEANLFVFNYMLWLISANWCLTKKIASGMTFTWSDKPWYIYLALRITIRHITENIPKKQEGHIPDQGCFTGLAIEDF